MSDSWEQMANDAVTALAKAESHIADLQARVAGLEAAAKEGLISWAREKPGIGRLCLIYGRWDAEPVLCEMTSEGPTLAQDGIEVEYGPMSCGDCGISLALELKYGALWSYVPEVPDWDNMPDNELAELLSDERKEGE